MASNAQESSTCELPQSSGSASRGKRYSYARANTIGWIKPRPRIQRALELTAQHLRGEINRPRANYSRKFGIYLVMFLLQVFRITNCQKLYINSMNKNQCLCEEFVQAVKKNAPELLKKLSSFIPPSPPEYG